MPISKYRKNKKLLLLTVFSITFAVLIIGSISQSKNTKFANAQKSQPQDINTEIQDKISETKILHLSLRKQSKNNKEYMDLLRKLNTAELDSIKSAYAKIQINEKLEIEEMKTNEARKLLSLTVARYEELNSLLYRIIERIEAQSDQITNSGFDNEDYNKELETITTTLGNIEANNSAIFFIVDKLQKKELSPEDAVKFTLNIGTNSKLEYDKVFSELSFLIKDAK